MHNQSVFLPALVAATFLGGVPASAQVSIPGATVYGQWSTPSGGVFVASSAMGNEVPCESNQPSCRVISNITLPQGFSGGDVFLQSFNVVDGSPLAPNPSSQNPTAHRFGTFEVEASNFTYDPATGSASWEASAIWEDG